MKCSIKIRVPVFVFFCLFCGFSILTPVLADEAGTPPSARPIPINLIISQNIRPYMDAAEAMRAAMNEAIRADIHVYELFRYKGNARNSLAEELKKDSQSALFISVGPEATGFLWQEVAPPSGHKLYSIVLNPEGVSPDISSACGVSLNIPPAYQLFCISESLPQAKRIGIFYDPAYNQDFFEKAAGAVYGTDVLVVPLAVSSKKDIPEVFSASVQNLDAIWLIPDRTVISESIAQYIIKQSLLQGVPVVGYNQFFYESGAAAAFVFDYAALGRQTARMAINLLKEGQCRFQVPGFEVWINQTVYKKLGIALPELDKPLVVGP